MLHARLFKETARFRDDHFRPTRSSLESKEKPLDAPWLDGNPTLDRPLFVQFCANRPDDLLEAAQYVAPYCDAVDLNLGCPQGIARAGHYGAFLQEDWDTIYKMINRLHTELLVPVTAKMRILETREKTLEYAKMILSAGANILTVHGRRREQKGHNTGLADWSVIRYLRDNLPPETVLFANGNILNSNDIEACLAATGADGIMSAEGNLSDPTIFAKPPTEYNPREYWYAPDGRGGYRMDAVYRRYLDIIHQYSLEKVPPSREPLYIPGDREDIPQTTNTLEPEVSVSEKRKRGDKQKLDPSLKAMQGHIFQFLRPLLSVHTDIRDVLAKTRGGDIDGFEKILTMVEAAVKKGLSEDATSNKGEPIAAASEEAENATVAELPLKQKTLMKYQRPWWVCQPYIRPLPDEAVQLGAITARKSKALKLLATDLVESKNDAIQRTDDLDGQDLPLNHAANELPKPALVCG